MLEINEIFGPTIQGEGKLVGTPSIFIRFGKCNFKCEGFQVEYETPSGVKKCACDSYYAVDTEFKDTWTKYKSYDEIVNEVDILLSKYPNNYKIDIVITGGEPLLYSDFISDFIKIAPKNWNVSCETSLNTPLSKLKMILEDIIEFIVDIKDMSPALAS